MLTPVRGEPQAGAFYGEAGIPEGWRAKLADRQLIGALAEHLYELSRAMEAG